MVTKLQRSNVRKEDVEDALKYGLRIGCRGEELLARLVNLEYGRAPHELEVGTEYLDEDIEELETKLAVRRALKQLYSSIPGFDPEGLVYGSNSDYVDIVAAVSHATGQINDIPSVLVSAAEEAHYRTTQAHNVQLRGQWTRTPAIYFKQDNKWYVAFDDSSDPTENIVLARAEELRNAHHDNDGVCVLPQSDSHISIMLNRARRAGRVVPVLEDSPRGVQTDAFGDHEIMKALFHEDVARNYGNWLRQRGRQSVNLYTCESSYLDGLEIPDDSVNVRGVRLDVIVIGVVNAVVRFNDGYCARSVARVSGIGNS